MVKGYLQRALCALLFFSGCLWSAPRVISLSPGNTELAFAAGITPVAVSAWSDYPPKARHIEQVASWQGVNIERILALKPDVVLAWRGGNPQRAIEQLQSLGLKVVWIDARNIDDIVAALRLMGQWSPTPDQARRAADTLARQWQALRARYGQRSTPKRVFMQFGETPMFTSGAGSLQNDILAVCGGKNIFADSKVPWPQVSREQVLIRKPELILTTGGPQKIQVISQFWGNQLSVPVISINDDWFERAGPRIILAAKQICAALAQ
ncbi:vitamin B12 ABC transporter substrate-binding protein BtuF [Shimwellia blattae]|uniref:Vitamin B12-binding protein n=1 Tax=Shimwellia blattae (strain ATCC 29907 / DSM 4481 / JCM 1650 / NBRC 105725 / CDC 9005-74) TaxID=630626 RepID=I2BCL4_SHIBC|nr:vitamin B12 ABC transporter substrate-binding protein BtuF [Shimwellia blattae]AFJ48268.1 vitamin B12-transporter protein BtuF [Shimwellia blattae DSM 4481 = NBRC 105725]GAB80963.1 vitamin B12 ABC transporter substrate-binding protein [Shimwellia blattae DSM 4481 = NBRC 105725]VDY65763.1 Vitamin B12-binding protein precursor [Shimwellia blattae]VEC25677.1 Vitamin B12-binding protein precursor [Shimwellia blattae]